MPARRWLAIGLVLASTLLLAVGVAASIATPERLAGDDASAGWTLISFAITIAAFAVVGGLISLRQPGNRIGWLLAVIGLLFAVVVAASAISAWALRTGSLPQPVAEWISVPTSAWVIGLGLIGTQLPLRLPDGRLPSPRWRWYSRVTIGLIAVALVGMTAQRGRVEDIAGTSNPLGAEWAEPLAYAFLGVIVSFVGGLAALVVRYRRAGAHDRVQLRWVAFGGAIFFAVYVVTLPLANALGDSTEATIVTATSAMAFAALPISIGHAVLRHRLYDIDVVINRTLVYAALTATLAGAYLGTVLLLQLVLGPLTADSGLAVAGSTLATAALFAPARARIQAGVDRRFFRRRYDAARTLEAFGARLRDEVDLDALSAELQAVVGHTMQPAHVSLWLRRG
ncbi:MAG: hypothetical protein M3N04_09030 [Actinomycetota bacterium]|nr:hypothetical protein [Actinomycetota bacterium]